MMYPNFWRGMVLSQGGMVFVLTLFIIVRYSMDFGRGGKRDKALPWHIVPVATSYLIGCLVIIMAIYEHWDNNHLTYRTYLGGVTFVLGNFGLIFMLIHIGIQRKFLGQVRDHVMNENTHEKAALAEELKRQTTQLRDDIREVGQKAEAAYHEANTVNEKLAKLHEDVSTAQDQTGEIITHIEETGKDTNTRVRKIEPKIVGT